MNNTNEKSGINLISFFIPLIIASTLPDILVQSISGEVPSLLAIGKIALLAYFTTTEFVMSRQDYSKFILMLIMINIGSLLTSSLESSSMILKILDPNTFTGAVGGPVLSKMAGAFIVLIILVFSYNTPKRAYIARGDLNNKAQLGNTELSWKLIAGIVSIIFVVLYFGYMVVSGSIEISDLGLLTSNLPVIISLAMMSSLAEGIMYRSSLLAALKDSNFSKNLIYLFVGLFYGLASYYFIPGGFINIIIYSTIGYIMAKSSYETEGFVSAWVMNIVVSATLFSAYYLINFA
ncbi:MAG: type II CAAX prenyl endopeptidase Rce1 family protein [Clostridia bacterium]